MGRLKVVTYLRVSTYAQADGLGLDVQGAAITEWARAHEHEIAAEFSDTGVSGSNGLDTRTGLADAFNNLRRAVRSLIVRQLLPAGRGDRVNRSVRAEVEEIVSGSRGSRCRNRAAAMPATVAQALRSTSVSRSTVNLFSH